MPVYDPSIEKPRPPEQWSFRVFLYYVEQRGVNIFNFCEGTQEFRLFTARQEAPASLLSEDKPGFPI
jgi:hypothetical protein